MSNYGIIRIDEDESLSRLIEQWKYVGNLHANGWARMFKTDNFKRRERHIARIRTHLLFLLRRRIPVERYEWALEKSRILGERVVMWRELTEDKRD